ncbi:MAG TPA: FAD-dependent oxidoreductase [Bryobacteraceae bacterium]|jgi:glycine/D-amino acid oxidase-like deaminating enzyme|nr:FAD-dependent oxidoreductase [Bryobacteraceae bacterium]
MTLVRECDVLIVGGGVTGLWLANDLDARGHQFVLFERQELGGAQTCHSHVYIHQGYIYNEQARDLAVHLKDVTPIWWKWLRGHPWLIESSSSFFGFSNETEYALKTALWSKPDVQMGYSEVARSDWPEALLPSAAGASRIRHLVLAPEVSLNGHLLVSALENSVRESICRMESFTLIRADASGIEAEACIANGARMRVRARYLVFAAGSGNLKLLMDSFPGEIDSAKSPQQIRRAHMLVIKGRPTDLPLLNGVFASLEGLFLVSRQGRDENVWLVSDYRNGLIETHEDEIVYNRRWWLPLVLENLQHLAPAVMARSDRFRWGVYEAPKAEGSGSGKLPEKERIYYVKGRNTWAVWPTKLTLAPLASRALLEQMELRPIRPGIAPEKWETTECVTWDEFESGEGL